MSDLKSIENEWQSPSAIWRSAPFWSWNSELEPERLQAEIQSMHDAGMGGAFMHSRYGLKTPYLSDRWFECVSACVEKCRELDMHAYMYDEDRWPSGPAGGLVTREHPEFRLKYLSMNYDEPDPATEKVHAVFDVELDDEDRLVSYEMLGGPGEIMTASEAEPKHRAMFFCPGMQEPSGWTNDGGYLDTMNPEAVAKFISVTHDAYAERYADDMGTIIPAVFTDEPSYGAQIHTATRVPWTCIFAEEFEARRGYDLKQRLPELFLPLAEEGYSRVRHDFFQTAMELFVEAFSQQIGEWCEEHNIAATGHMLAEQTLASQRQADGAVMPHYEWMQWPGIDMLRDQMNELTTAKQATSVADQLGHERVLSETYGCTGWDWPLEGHKFSGDWQWACGVNFRCPHLTHYSLAGGAKRDYPASIRDHSPWWAYYNEVEDYFARLSVMLTQGTPVRDVLVLHTVESGWGLPTDTAGSERINALEEQLEAVIYTLSNAHFDWDFGDEALMAKYAEIEGDEISIGEMSYRLVVVPPSITLRSSTMDLLEAFAEAGGEVLFVAEVAERVDAQPDPRPSELATRTRICCCDADELIEAVEDIIPRRIAVLEEDRPIDYAWSMLREVDGGHVLFLDSHDREVGHSVRVRVDGHAPVIEWDPRTGERRAIPAWEADGMLAFDVWLEPTGSALFTLGVEVEDTQPFRERMNVIARDEIGGPFEIELTEPNTLPLDYCRFRVEDEEWSEPVPVLKADELIRARYGLGKRFGSSHQPWYLYKTGVVDTAPREHCDVRWSFHVTDVPASCRLALENPEDYVITVNGNEVSEVEGWWVDDDIETIDISEHVQEGDNEINLSFTYRPTMEIEDGYLLGDFGVTTRDGVPRPGSMTLTAAPETLEEGSWVGQGLDTYGGAVRYRVSVDRPADDQRVRLSLPELSCTAAVLHAGGEQWVLPWAPFAADITDALDEGENEVVVEVIGGRHNIFGPLHTPWEAWTGPGEFDPDNEKWRFEYYLNDHGLMGPVLVETLKKA
ncbi:MAG: glycosyl hydrolase [Armatimonadota bacterium]